MDAMLPLIIMEVKGKFLLVEEVRSKGLESKD